jgi:hypothetical protein
MKGEWRQNKLKQEEEERERERERERGREIWIKGCDSAREKDR